MRRLLVCLGAAVVLLQVAAGPEGPRRRPGRRKMPPLLTVGQKAPDIELPRLALEKTTDGRLLGKVSDETVRLSSAWPKRPVCVFLSSYT